MAHGGNKYAGAGVGGVIAGESSGDPESIEAGGGGGEGIMQWTPGSSAKPIYPIITGNANLDMANQLVDMMTYIAGRGGIGSINSAGSALGAAEVFSRMEAPLVPGSDIDAGVVASLYAQGLAAGGKITSGTGPSADDVLARVSKGETVVSAADSKILAPLFAALGIPGYASGGKVSGASYLKAWTGSGAPEINTQIGTWTKNQSRDSTLAGAKGLSRALHAKYVSAAADDKKHITSLTAERQVLRDWRTSLGTSDSSLSSWISAAGKTPALKGSVAAWKKQLASQKASIAGVSKMLGLTPAEQSAAAASKAAAASAAAAASSAGASSSDTSSSDGSTASTTTATPAPAPLTAASVTASLAGIGPQGGLGAMLTASVPSAATTAGTTSASAGPVTEPVLGWGFGGPGGGSAGSGPAGTSGGGGATLADVIREIRKLNATTAAVPAGVGAHVGGALGGATSAASFRSRYPRGGA